jgi:hypothetical protein
LADITAWVLDVHAFEFYRWVFWQCLSVW